MPAQDGVNSIQGSVLVDGLMAAFWNLRRPAPGAAALVIRPFWSWPAADRAAVEDEGRRLLAWIAPADRRPRRGPAAVGLRDRRHRCRHH